MEILKAIIATGVPRVVAEKIVSELVDADKKQLEKMVENGMVDDFSTELKKARLRIIKRKRGINKGVSQNLKAKENTDEETKNEAND